MSTTVKPATEEELLIRNLILKTHEIGGEMIYQTLCNSLFLLTRKLGPEHEISKAIPFYWGEHGPTSEPLERVHYLMQTGCYKNIERVEDDTVLDYLENIIESNVYETELKPNKYT